MAYQFSALQDTHVNEIQIYTIVGFNSPESFVNIGTAYNNGNIGTFAWSSKQDSVVCVGGPSCDLVTFTGDARLHTGTTYWLGIGSTSTDPFKAPTTYWYQGEPTTRNGLALQHALGTSDIRSTGGLSFNSLTDGYPWVRMFSRARQGTDTAQPPPPAPTIQQFGRPASETCDAAAPASLNWSGVASGGWGESWAEWMNDGKGGAVCTRTLVYSTSLARWTVG